MSALPHADPGRGVFETMLVIAGRPVELDAHVERLDTSLAALYGAELPANARETVRDEARGIACGKLRITVAPSVVVGERLDLRMTSEEIEPAAVFPGPERGIALNSVTVTGGLGEHKWADRRMLENTERSARIGELPLLVDDDGAVLEASRGSVFAAGADWLATPPTDGRILPSIARRQAIGVAEEVEIEVREQRLTLGDLRDAEIFLAGSVRGIEPVRSLDGVELSPAGRVSARLAAGLKRRWLRVPQGEPVAVGAGGRRAGPPGR